MNAVNYLLLFNGNSDEGGPEASVRGFARLGSAKKAMVESYRKIAAALNIPVDPNASSNPYATKTKNGIRLERSGDYFRWEIVKAVPEDDEPDSTSVEASVKRQRGLAKYTVTIEEHRTQAFSVEACDIFDAMQSAEMAYKQGSLIVQPSTPNARLIMAQDDTTGEMTEWKEF